ncbi:hypothetical protein D3C72_2279010 [compost metagenome]
MVARTHQHLWLREHRGIGTEHLADAQGQRFQPPQRTEWFGLVVQQVLQTGGQGGIGDVSDGRNGELGQLLHGV